MHRRLDEKIVFFEARKQYISSVLCSDFEIKVMLDDKDNFRPEAISR